MPVLTGVIKANSTATVSFTLTILPLGIWQFGFRLLNIFIYSIPNHRNRNTALLHMYKSAYTWINLLLVHKHMQVHESTGSTLNIH